MHIATLLTAIPRSFYSKSFYREVRQFWQGLGMLYLLLVISLAGLVGQVIIFIYTLGFTLTHPMDIEYVLEQIPPLEFKNGELSARVLQPYYIHLKETDDFYGVIDTTREVSEWNTHDFSGIVLGKTQAMTKQRKGKTELQAYPADLNYTLTRDDARTAAEMVLAWIPWISWILYPVIVSTLFIYAAIKMSFYALGGWLIAKLMRVPLFYSDVLRLACATAAPVLLITMVGFPLLGIHAPWLVYFAISIGYLVFAIHANKRNVYDSAL